MSGPRGVSLRFDCPEIGVRGFFLPALYKVAMVAPSVV